MKESSFLLLQAQLRTLFPNEGLHQLAIYEDQTGKILIFSTRGLHVLEEDDLTKAPRDIYFTIDGLKPFALRQRAGVFELVIETVGNRCFTLAFPDQAEAHQTLQTLVDLFT
ncbi:hypothetical protein P7H00_11980 [Enterococcus pseudoavium]|uniref:Uncharacterized protein n=1 Tax=Enterococcus pseudoavium TaxID=44007 RepID=A0AAE4I2S1_9ENTE|nr:hypothetical protein [Enterococcus pseudoavium]MDT2737828.1 hypothetical protein [Enterococcus pseudoavium]MDT2754703.1 hypothetical protein [Enterococcus pseudoavium]MDT2770478.1 hypothetical protein [Enterococcus pseudoavium]REC33109.1 hypothetical protein CF160_12035 [Enterococcus pseudoavium]